MKSHGNTEAGFTLLELLAAMAILALMVAMLFSAFNQASRAWLQAENRVETFTQARAALDLMSREISQAIVTSNISFLGSATSVAFIAPVSTDPTDIVDLEEVVYRLNGGYLERLVTPFSAGNVWDFYAQPQNWPATTSSTVTVADNIVSLTFTYQNTNGVLEAFWNSTQLPSVWSANKNFTSASFPAGMTNRTPAGVQIEIDAIDSRTAARLLGVSAAVSNNIITPAVKAFFTFVAIPNRQP
jgi:prepilin-type N-terminal cleavage/methylation domain-containing protein